MNNNNQQQFSVHTDDGCQDSDSIGEGHKTIITFPAYHNHIMEHLAWKVGWWLVYRFVIYIHNLLAHFLLLFIGFMQ